ncbi:MAG: hypothetical protein E6J02_08815 [Chloroflexi bacterium]|nr:MAG: hypothetical protein E6J02_08815 [Chloroflexota bacterium]TME13093.1 MAG: hypothetical protein E6I70_16215 [Chloroflexota bacterium]TME16445.1 MAG: hypothetical protein E6I63_06420 [Chloroflexota bacterium]
MARKQKRRKQRPARAPQPPAGTAAAPRTAIPATSSRPASPSARVGGDQALVRAVEMSLGGSARMGGKGRGRFVIDGGDPGIPLDRVPYFLTDLRQIAIVGALMVVLLVVAAYFVIPQVLK